MTKVLITGITGYIGFQTLVIALERGLSVRGVVRHDRNISSLLKLGVSTILALLNIQGMSGGSVTTVLESIATWGPWWFLFGNSWILAPPDSVPSKFSGTPLMSRLFGYRQISELGGALTTSFVGINNEPIVHRSYAKNPKLYGTQFHFKEYLPVGESGGSFLSTFVVHICTYFGVLVISIPPLRALLRMFLPATGSGPYIAEARTTESVVYHPVGIPSSRKDMKARAVFQRQGSLYEFTALMACVAARVVRDKEFREHGGFSTPSFLGMEYVEALRGAGVDIGVSLEPCKQL